MDFDIQWHDNSGRLNVDPKDIKMSVRASNEKPKRKIKFNCKVDEQIQSQIRGLEFLRQWQDICKYTRRSK